MNDYYWNEYKSMLLDEDFLIKTLKNHQLSIQRKESNKNKKWINSILDVQHVKFSDTRIDQYKLDVLPKILKDVFENLKKIYSYFTYKVSMPILTLSKNIDIVKAGNYSFDFESNELILYEENLCEVKEIIGNEGVLITFFLNIEDSICLYQRKAYIKGIEEIGYVCKSFLDSIKNNKQLVLKTLFLSEQKLTKDLGLNLRKCLLIDYVYFEV